MKRSTTWALTLFALLLLLPLALLCSEPAEARARRPVQPKLLFTVAKVEAAAAPGMAAQLRAALDKALAAEPLVITKLGLKKPTPGRTAWELRRRRLRWFAITVRLESVSHKVVTLSGRKLLVAEARVSLSGKRRERFRKGTVNAAGLGKSSTVISVVLQGEVLASRLAAVGAAAAEAVRNAVTKLTAKKKRRGR